MNSANSANLANSVTSAYLTTLVHSDTSAHSATFIMAHSPYSATIAKMKALRSARYQSIRWQMSNIFSKEAWIHNQVVAKAPYFNDTARVLKLSTLAYAIFSLYFSKYFFSETYLTASLTSVNLYLLKSVIGNTDMHLYWGILGDFLCHACIKGDTHRWVRFKKRKLRRFLW